jgi:RimJ/RimL family protein N-acetyltransferase
VDAFQLATERLVLVLQTPEVVLASIEKLSPADRAQVSADWLATIRGMRTANPWLCGFEIVLRDSNIGIGRCGYKGPPNANGMVEIAYGIDEQYRGNGFATEAAQALVDFAFGNDQVHAVCAHTLAELNASTRVLTKSGFARIGDVIDPEDGLVWRWEKHKSQTDS